MGDDPQPNASFVPPERTPGWYPDPASVNSGWLRYWMVVNGLVLQACRTGSSLRPGRSKATKAFLVPVSAAVAAVLAACAVAPKRQPRSRTKRPSIRPPSNLRLQPSPHGHSDDDAHDRRTGWAAWTASAPWRGARLPRLPRLCLSPPSRRACFSRLSLFPLFAFLRRLSLRFGGPYDDASADV